MQQNNRRWCRKLLNVKCSRLLTFKKNWTIGLLSFRRWYFQQKKQLPLIKKKKQRIQYTYSRRVYVRLQRAKSVFRYKKQQNKLVKYIADLKKISERVSTLQGSSPQKEENRTLQSIRKPEAIDPVFGQQDPLNSYSNLQFPSDKLVNGKPCAGTELEISTSPMKEYDLRFDEEEISKTVLVFLKGCRKKQTVKQQNHFAASSVENKRISFKRSKIHKASLSYKRPSVFSLWQQLIRSRVIKRGRIRTRFKQGNLKLSKSRVSLATAEGSVGIPCSLTFSFDAKSDGNSQCQQNSGDENDTVKTLFENGKVLTSENLTRGGLIELQGEKMDSKVVVHTPSKMSTARTDGHTQTDQQSDHEVNFQCKSAECGLEATAESAENMKLDSLSGPQKRKASPCPEAAKLQLPSEVCGTEVPQPGKEEPNGGSVKVSGDGALHSQHFKNVICHKPDAENQTGFNISNTNLLDHPYCRSVQKKKQLKNATDTLDSSKGEEVLGQQNCDAATDEQLKACIHGFLTEYLEKYGSFIPLTESDVLARLKTTFGKDFSNKKRFILVEIKRCAVRLQKTPGYKVLYKKHVLDLEDLSTLDRHNWLNDQVINMYGELIMDRVPEKVHFFNSFFYRQLVTKGYNGVKRWTKNVDIFRKTLLLIPIHLSIHWSLITVNLPSQTVYFYDSQGIHFKFCVENIQKYILTEAKEKDKVEFLEGWRTVFSKCIPQQKNDSDCGTFMLQYCKCLALEQPFEFSQEDMPKVRKRIYKELCECRLLD
ncbi:sentrin-specific protease 5 [Latimeria chalumnae]|uniref:SUMO specific peptidase 5 n=1 Tax=Latimeria chalumnae TaxID=7897 RepID=H3BDC2_LATCH|nr:PREDICTED: sentrin-specific protease 5 [Latimeria chalumnae]XP_005989457.1 PREDICTED: sentrin-specific protease 5 [Latimeria chalumnae]|eukprot:XP_005989456.1 PREDICTED: sentrin-specific protease 5 [Latimeria chalumnae]